MIQVWQLPKELDDFSVLFAVAYITKWRDGTRFSYDKRTGKCNIW